VKCNNKKMKRILLSIGISLLLVNVYGQNIINYTYDRAGRIIEEDYEGIYLTNFSYDREGNLLLKSSEYYISSSRPGGLDQQDQQIRIFPNPSGGIINIFVDSPASYSKLEIYTISGQLLRREAISSSRKSMDISSLKNGIYLFYFWGDRDLSITKLVKK